MSEQGTTGRAADDLPPDESRGAVGLGSDGAWQVRFRRHLRHPPERVWQALSDPGQQRQWVPGVTIEARSGGSVDFDFGDEGRATGEVTLADPPHVLEHTWLWPDEVPAVVRWELADDGHGGTELTLLHHPIRQAPAADYASGWHVMLDALRIHLDGGVVAAMQPDFAALYTVYAAAAGGATQ